MNRRVCMFALMIVCLATSLVMGQSRTKVMLIVWDGSQRTVVEPMMREGQLPNLARVSRVVHTLTADNPCFPDLGQRCECMTTETKPQFATMMTGVLANVHGVFTNRCFREVPAGLTVGEQLEVFDPRIRTAHISSKVANPGDEVFGNLSTSIDYYVSDFLDPNDATNLALAKLNQWAGESFFMMVHLREPDRTGHLRGVKSDEYKDRLLEVDRQLGRVLDSLTALGILREVHLYIASDHGFGNEDGPKGVRDFLHTNAPHGILVTNDTNVQDLHMSDVAPVVMRHFR